MATFEYTALRNLKSGHSVDTDYTITIELMRLDDEMPRPAKIEHRSLGGATLTVLNRIDRHIQIATDYINTDNTGTPDVDDFAEFLDSVAAGEQFTFNNGSDQTVIMVGRPQRIRTGIKFNYTFEMRVVT